MKQLLIIMIVVWGSVWSRIDVGEAWKAFLAQKNSGYYIEQPGAEDREHTQSKASSPGKTSESSAREGEGNTVEGSNGRDYGK